MADAPWILVFVVRGVLLVSAETFTAEDCADRLDKYQAAICIHQREPMRRIRADGPNHDERQARERGAP